MNDKEENKLSSRGVRPTAMRILVLKYMTNLTHTTSLLDLEMHFSTADRSTLFRTLKTFEKKGIIHKIEDGTGVLKYGLCTASCSCSLSDQHFHFYCEKCQETFCLNQVKIPNIEIPKHFVLKQSNLVLKGLCSNCN
ncbi:MAG: transcriptional repressor [Flavobacteriaceae bacterium]|nr:MAG: transcriptional repressor [Flavobacteriaceae bacterium]